MASDAKPVRVAVAGLGYFSRFHLDAWHRNPNAHLVAVTDPDGAKVEQVATRYDATGCQDADAMLTGTGTVILDIVAPPAAHLDLIKNAAGRVGLIICQKPFCCDLQEAQQAVEVARKSGTSLIVHENFRFQPWYRALKKFLTADGLGQVYQCRFALRPGDGRGLDAYLGRQPGFRHMPRFLIHETGVHFVDLFQWLFGPVESVYADTRQRNPVIAGEDCGIMLLRHGTGVQSLFDGNRLSDHASDDLRRTMGEMVVEGAKGTVRLDGQGRLWFRAFGNQDEVPVPVAGPVDEHAFGGGCVAALIDHAVRALGGVGGLENRAADYLSVITVVEAAYLSAQTGRRVDL